ncbi:hypothetical protein M413DRAFT_448801 [Hebeloma cylindrosporum]|uniref:Uncharacterized protein n=1 Tax=Hebeloma cylindrosporum TaxID=76867 RepID=A0A0C2Y7Z3_HEBCY|nr:hypothetical protein M413DRAFT_448801 [Hebeloma cylindrosporum h7]
MSSILNAPRLRCIPLPQFEERDDEIARWATSPARTSMSGPLLLAPSPNPSSLLSAAFSVRVGSSLKDMSWTNAPVKSSGTPHAPIQQPPPAPRGASQLGARRFG